MDPTNVVVIEGKDADEPPPAPPPVAAEGKTDGVVKETEELTVELVGPEKGEEQTAGVEKLETVAAVVDQPLPASQEAVEAAEAAAVASEASLDIDAVAHEAQVRAVREGEAPAQATTEETGESAQVSTVELVRHRASWWNCCGLLDAITGSKDSSTST